MAYTNYLGTASWADPEEFERNRSYEPGDFWLGRSPVSGAALGHADDRHTLLACGSRAGKGVSVIIPNLCLWPGSIFVIDPKGENATVTASRRGKGSDYCEGMGQKVHVLDPFATATVNEEYRARLNPLDELDLESPTFFDDVGAITAAIVPRNPDSKEPFWEDSARQILKTIIIHVLTDPRFEDARTLVTVRGLISRGLWEVYRLGREEGITDLPSPHRLLWQSMSENEALGGQVAAEGAKLLSRDDRDPKLLESQLQTLHRHTEFIDSPGMAECLSASDFSLKDLKSDPNGVSVFLCLPQRFMTEHFRWLRMLVTLSMSAAEADPGQPKSGHRTIFFLDEFAALQRMESVENAVAQIAGFGVTLFFVLQSLEQLKAVYKDRWETFVANCSTKIFFGLDDFFTRDYISKMIGETEVLRELESNQETTGTSQTTTEGTSESETRGENRGFTNTETEGTSRSHSRSSQRSQSSGRSDSETVGEGTSQSYSTNESYGTSNSRTEGSGHSRGRGTNRGSSANTGGGWDRERGLFGDTGSFFPFLRENETINQGSSTSSGSNENWSKNWNKSQTRGENFSRGSTDTRSRNTNHSKTTGSNYSESTSYGQSDTTGETQSRSRSETHGESHSATRGRTRSEAFGETQSSSWGHTQNLQKRRLVTPDELGRFFDRREDGGPNWGLVLIGGNSPAVVHRSPYYADQQLAWLFDPHPDWDAPPKLIGQEAVPLLGDSGAIVRVLSIPNKLAGQKVSRGDQIATALVPNPHGVELSHLEEELGESLIPEEARVLLHPLRTKDIAGYEQNRSISSAELAIGIPAPVEGTVVDAVGLASYSEDDPPNFQVSCMITVNRRQYQNALPASEEVHPLERTREILVMLSRALEEGRAKKGERIESARAEELARQEQERREEEARQAEEEARRRENERQKEEERAKKDRDSKWGREILETGRRNFVLAPWWLPQFPCRSDEADIALLSFKASAAYLSIGALLVFTALGHMPSMFGRIFVSFILSGFANVATWSMSFLIELINGSTWRGMSNDRRWEAALKIRERIERSKKSTASQ